MFLPKRRLTLNGLHGVISQKMVFFINTSVETSNPTKYIKLTLVLLLSFYLCLYLQSCNFPFIICSLLFVPSQSVNNKSI
jgi:hypothetical protein